MGTRERRSVGKNGFDCAKVGDKTAAAVVGAVYSICRNGIDFYTEYIFQPSKNPDWRRYIQRGRLSAQPTQGYVYAGDYNKYREKTKIAVATLFNDAGIIGAALSAKRVNNI